MVGVVAGADEGSGFDYFHAAGKAFFLEHRKNVWMHKAIERQVVASGLQVLSDRENVG